MRFFDIFRSQEKVYYRHFKKLVNDLKKGEKVTISSLRTTVMSLEMVIKNIKDSAEVILNQDELEDVNLKIKVLEILLIEAKQNFIRGVVIKLKEIGESEFKCVEEIEIHLLYNKCALYSRGVEDKYWRQGRHIAEEEIKNYKSNEI